MKTGLKKIYGIVKKYHWINRLEFFMHHALQSHQNNSLYFSKCGNFGDELNDDLMRYFGIKYKHTRPLGADLCCVGSNLQEFISNSSKTVSKRHRISVLGPGFISEERKEEKFMFDMKIYALRGELSKQRCVRILDDLLPNVALGDPGLLVRRMFPEISLSARYDVGIICHKVDKNSELLQNIKLKESKVLFIDVEQEPALFVKQVAQCKFILSSAMHGLICADSLGVPNKHIILGNNVVGGEYKFRDYYSVFPNFKYSPVYLKDRMVTKKDIDRYVKDYNITSNEVEAICNNLEVAFGKFKHRRHDV